ncbi:hypothetical protein ACPTG9_05870 [Enterococcus faecalis]|uniref:hypothetical protein n=1 Tax=Enterococcus faecalis TaxID=1351 RepID=UPI000E08E0FF|nr:hypothetical protein [Enterococcus faecalis]AXG89535.1 hypothetical protein DTO64_13580 [Enterococcus faecalis]EGO6085133.1 hypothetical protein [Enterococcus faecalis]EIT2194750.1 hypothetical protein [Enterococcus faecalis]EJB2749861.1 hypothetical protein [Enterococcus faecalis]ELY8687301.1 hypothetical protein [Enterococcus faecalis]
MSVYAITYDLKKPNQDYDALNGKIKSLGAYSKRFDSFWLVDSSLSASEIRDNLKTEIDSNDSLFVIQTKEHWASLNLAKGATEWLKSESRTF